MNENSQKLINDIKAATSALELVLETDGPITVAPPTSEKRAEFDNQVMELKLIIERLETEKKSLVEHNDFLADQNAQLVKEMAAMHANGLRD